MADLGGAWTIPAGTDRFSAAGGGRMRLQPGDGFAARLESLLLATTDIRVAVSANSAPDAVGHYTSVIGRSVDSNTDYSVKVRTAADGSVAAWLVRRVANVETVLSSAAHPTLRVPAGQTMTVRLRVSGQGTSTVQTKVWAASTAELSTWWLSATDATPSLQRPGSPGLHAYSHGPASGQSVIFRWGRPRDPQRLTLLGRLATTNRAPWVTWTASGWILERSTTRSRLGRSPAS